MPKPTRKDTAALMAGITQRQLPNGAGANAWAALLHAHASLMRRLDTDLRSRTGAGINEFDVLAVVAQAGGAMRMTELAEQAFSSRSGMTRRVERLVGEGFLCRGSDDQDGRGVVVALTDAGVARLAQIAPVHLQGIAQLFVSQLSDRELKAFEKMLRKISAETTFG